LITTSCATPPAKPTIELCVIDAPALEAICGQTNGEALLRATKSGFESVKEEIIKSQNVERHPIIYIDKGIAFKPDEWKTLKSYIDALERFTENHCQAQ